jgi:Kef-type K+ transport system membrane component KefB
MNRIEFIGNAIFIPYFLIGVGMLINLQSLSDGLEVWGIMFLIVFCGTFGKALAAYISALLFRLTKTEGKMMFGLTSAHAAGAIAMVMVGRRLMVDTNVALADDHMLNGVVIMILVTCIISTLTTERASQDIVIANTQHPSSNNQKNDDERIMVCVKYPEIAPQLLELALLIRNQKLKRELVALNVVYDGEGSIQEREKGIQLLEKL